MPTLPRQGPSNESSQEFRYGSQKFKSSNCGVEMFAGGEARLPYLHGKPLPGRLHGDKQVGIRVTIVALSECDLVFEGVAARWFCCKMRPICRTIAGSTRFFARTSAQSGAAVLSFTMYTGGL